LRGKNPISTPEKCRFRPKTWGRIFLFEGNSGQMGQMPVLAFSRVLQEHFCGLENARVFIDQAYKI